LVEIHESQLVTGDIIKIQEGMDIPVDMLVLEAHDITTDESALTGEPDAIKKKIYKECLEKRNEIIVNGQKNDSKSHDVYSPVLMSGTTVKNNLTSNLLKGFNRRRKGYCLDGW